MPRNGPGHHLATISHEGRFWDVYVELDAVKQPNDSARARLIFSAADGNGDDPVVTGFIFVEGSPEAAIARAQSLSPHQILGILRSCLP